MPFAGLLGRSETVLAEATRALTERLGPAAVVSDISDWSFSTYYQAEMGADLKRQFIFFGRPITADGLAEIKCWTNAIERALAVADRRRVNLDPGYLAPSKLVLATTKDFSHRIYLRDGIYAEVTLQFRAGSFQPLPWTYPDYRTPAAIALFNAARERLLVRISG